MPRRRGARSVAGSLTAYLKAGIGAVLVMVVVLLLAVGREPPRAAVELSGDGPWTSATLDDGRRVLVVEAGQRIEAPPGDYRLLLLAADGHSERRRLTVAGELTLITP